MGGGGKAPVVEADGLSGLSGLGQLLSILQSPGKIEINTIRRHRRHLRLREPLRIIPQITVKTIHPGKIIELTVLVPGIIILVTAAQKRIHKVNIQYILDIAHHMIRRGPIATTRLQHL